MKADPEALKAVRETLDELRAMRKILEEENSVMKVNNVENWEPSPALRSWLIEEGECEPDGSAAYYRHEAGRMIAEKTLSINHFKSLMTTEDDMPDPEKVYQRRGNDRIEVKSEFGYSTTKSVQRNKHGLTVPNPSTGRDCESQSQQNAAEMGVLFKSLANRSGLASNPLSEHERDLLDSLYSKEWTGKLGQEWEDRVPGKQVKALLDESNLSGGLEITPIHFDSDVITFPLLTGELFPHVDLRPIPRGRRIEGASIETPTATWGGLDDVSIPLFDTEDMVSAIDTTIFVIDGAVEVGRDFLSDSPVEVGTILTGLIGERLQAELDKVISVGDGGTQPAGIFTSAGLTSVSAANGATGPPTLADYLSLLFSLPKQYRNANMRPMFVSNDVTYQRSREIRVDANSPSVDQRPVMTDTSVKGGFSSYETAGLPHKVQTDIGNRSCAIVAMSRYRMYRRQGLEIRWEQGGKDLARRNMMLLVFRARYGGRLMDTNAAAKWTDGQS
ncbi:MAG: phage major capsid protein [Planctomycetales bacterium]